MTTETIAISPQLTQLLDELANAVSTTAEVLQKIKDQAEKDGLTLEQTREVIITALKNRKLSDRQIRHYLPAELKDQKQVASRSHPNKAEEVTSTGNVVDTKKVDKQAEYEEENSFLEAKVKQLAEFNEKKDAIIGELQEALERAAQPQTADQAPRTELTEIIIEPRLYATLFLALRHKPAAIKLQVLGNRATGVIEAEML